MKTIIAILKYILESNPVYSVPKYLLYAVGYQIYKRLSGGVFSKNLFNGKKILIFPGNPIASSFIYSECHDKDEIEALRALSDENTIFLDIGANIGSYSLLLSDIVREVYAFEAHPVTANFCKMNFLLNHIDPAHVITKAIGASNTLRYFSNMSRGSPINAFVQKNDNAIQVQTITLDQFIESRQFPKNANFLVKIDVEGFEHEVLMGAQTFLANYAIRAILLEGFSTEYTEVEKKLIQLGFNVQFVANHNMIARKIGSKGTKTCAHPHLAPSHSI
jgi:FkbM family methyltransferase